MSIFSSLSVVGTPDRDQEVADRIAITPGLPKNVSFAHYSGFVILNKGTGKNLFVE